MNDSCIQIQNIYKEFITDKNETFTALDNINLTVNKSEFVCILGPSGCGKSTLLRIIAGLEQASAGSALYHGEKITHAQRQIGMVFQNYSLMPWLNVIDNIQLGLKFSKINSEQRLQIAEKYLDMIHMTKFKKSFPYELSGGMQQRVAIARALANNPDVLLMDEPFGALDAYTRIILQKELLKIWEQDKKTILFVTHSVDEAIYLADRVIFLSKNPGKIKADFRINLPRERQRSDPHYGELMDKMLSLFEEQ